MKYLKIALTCLLMSSFGMIHASSGVISPEYDLRKSVKDKLSNTTWEMLESGEEAIVMLSLSVDSNQVIHVQNVYSKDSEIDSKLYEILDAKRIAINGITPDVSYTIQVKIIKE